MSFVTTIYCPTNGLVLASFTMHPCYFYQLADGTELPLRVGYAWCHRCERFVEVERLYTLEEIQARIDELDSLHQVWTAARQWRENRKSPPRCLECGSVSAMVVVPEGEDVPHPAGKCMVRIGGGDHTLDASIPSRVFFSPEGEPLRPNEPPT